jgi:TrmH family RNA methyltransferase
MLRIDNQSFMGFSVANIYSTTTLITLLLFRSTDASLKMYSSNKLLHAIRAAAIKSTGRSCCCFAPTVKHRNIKVHVNNSRMSSRLYSSIPTHNWELITNHKTSKTVKLFKSVHRANKSKRSELGLTVAEGVRLVSDILSNEKSRQLVRRIVISESLIHDVNNDEVVGSSSIQYQKQLLHWIHIVDEESRQRNAEYIDDDDDDDDDELQACSINIATDEVVDACSGTVTSQGVVALMKIPPPFNPSSFVAAAAGNGGSSSTPPPFYLILDGLADPGNIGTLLRTCAATYATSLIVLPGGCDMWNPKVIRSSMGASFRVPIMEISVSDDEKAFVQVLSFLENCGVTSNRIYAATMETAGNNVSLAHYDVDFTRSGGGAAVVLGAEGEGLRQELRSAVKQGKISAIHVPMAPDTESLNAGVAGSVIMFERMRQLSSIMRNVKDR